MAQAKTPSIALYLELGSLKLRHIILKKRIMYFHTIINKNTYDITYKILKKQELDPDKGDFFSMIKSDFAYIGLKYDLNELRNTCKMQFKSKLKKLIENTAFKEYIKEKENMKKLENIRYSKLKMQSYIVSNELTNRQKQIIFRLRTNTFNVKLNLRKLHLDDLKCRKCFIIDESQEHVFTQCAKINGKMNIEEYRSIFRESPIIKETARNIDKIAQSWLQYLDSLED